MKRRIFALGLAPVALACAGTDKRVESALDTAGDWSKQARDKLRDAQYLVGQLSAAIGFWRESLPPEMLEQIDLAMGKALAALEVASELVALGADKIEEAKQAYAGNWLPAIRTVIDLLTGLGLFIPALSKLTPPKTASVRVDGASKGLGSVDITLPAEEL